MHDPGGHDAITELAEPRGERNDVVLADVSQWPEERVAVPGNAYVPRLSRQRRTGNMADRAPQGFGADSLHDDRRKAEARNFNAANQAAQGRRRICGGSGGRGLTYPAVRLLADGQQPLEFAPLSLLEYPGVHQNVRAIGQQQDAAGQQYALRPPRNPPQRLSGNYQPHLAAGSLAVRVSPPATVRFSPPAR